MVLLCEVFISGCRRTLRRGDTVRGERRVSFEQDDIYADVNDLYLFCSSETASCELLLGISALRSGQLPAADH